MSGSYTYPTYVAPMMTGMMGTIARSDGAFVPCDLGNMDYQAFLEWVAAGNTAPEGWTGPKNP